MPKRNNTHIILERQAKIPRRCLKTKEEESSFKSIENLPQEILEQILENISIWHHNKIRLTCSRFRDATDLLTWHKYRSELQNNEATCPTGHMYAILTTIDRATSAYVKAGCLSLFCGAILQMFRNNFKTPFCSNIAQVNMNVFLRHFYNLVDERMNDSYSSLSRLLYIITFVRLLKKFQKYAVESEILFNRMRIIFKFQGPWMGQLYASKNKSVDCPDGRRDLLIIIANLLIADIQSKSFKKVLWDTESEMYVYGNDTSDRVRSPKTVFVLSIYGTNKIYNLLQMYLDAVDEPILSPIKGLAKDNFLVHIDISCNEAVKWGCSKSLHVVVGPLLDIPSSDSDNSEDP